MFRVSIPDDEAGDPKGYVARVLGGSIVNSAEEFSKTVYRDTALSLREFEAGRRRIADINGCMVCRQFRAGRDAETAFSEGGQRPDKLVVDNGPAPDEAFYEAIADWRNSDLFSDRERLVIEFSERFAEEPKSLATDEEFWERARRLMGDKEIVDLSHCVAAWIAGGRIAHVLGLDTVCGPWITN